MSDYTVLNVTGPHATHHLSSGEGWIIRDSYLVSRADFTPNVTKSAKRATAYRIRQADRRAKRELLSDEVERVPCRAGCGRLVRRSDTILGIVRCVACRAAGRGVKHGLRGVSDGGVLQRMGSEDGSVVARTDHRKADR